MMKEREIMESIESRKILAFWLNRIALEHCFKNLWILTNALNYTLTFPSIACFNPKAPKLFRISISRWREKYAFYNNILGANYFVTGKSLANKSCFGMDSNLVAYSIFFLTFTNYEISWFRMTDLKNI